MGLTATPSLNISNIDGKPVRTSKPLLSRSLSQAPFTASLQEDWDKLLAVKLRSGYWKVSEGKTSLVLCTETRSSQLDHIVHYWSNGKPFLWGWLWPRFRAPRPPATARSWWRVSPPRTWTPPPSGPRGRAIPQEPDILIIHLSHVEVYMKKNNTHEGNKTNNTIIPRCNFSLTCLKKYTWKLEYSPKNDRSQNEPQNEEVDVSENPYWKVRLCRWHPDISRPIMTETPINRGI